MIAGGRSLTGHLVQLAGQFAPAAAAVEGRQAQLFDLGLELARRRVVQEIGEEHHQFDMGGDGVFGGLAIACRSVGDAAGAHFLKVGDEGADAVGADDQYGHGG